jgi:hypothetical protein
VAIAELVWDGPDADAIEVSVEYELNAFDSVDAVTVPGPRHHRSRLRPHGTVLLKRIYALIIIAHGTRRTGSVRADNLIHVMRPGDIR